MNAGKKLCLILTSVTMLLVIVNFAPNVVLTVSGIDVSQDISQSSSFLLSAAAPPPVTTAELTGDSIVSGWFISDVTVTLLVSGDIPDFTTAYSFDNVNWIPYESPFVISTEGTTTLYYNSTDAVGSVEETNIIDIQIDKSPPELFLEIESVPGQGVRVSIIAIEEVSYLLDVGYSFDGHRWSFYSGPILFTEEGVQEFYYKARDIAGNSVVKNDLIEVIIPPVQSITEVTYTGDITGVYSDPINLEASLIDVLTGLPIPDRLIVFTLGSQTASAATDTDGVAVISMVLDQPTGLYEVLVSFEGDDEYLASSASSEFQILKEDAFVYYSGLTIIDESDETLTLMATVIDDVDGSWGDLSKIYVIFTIYIISDDTTPIIVIDSIVVSSTDLAGIGIATVELSNLAEGEYFIVISLNPDQNLYYHSEDSDTTIITIYQSGRESVSGTGWIEDADGNRGHFVFMVKHTRRGGLKGFIFYTLRVDNLVYFVKSTDITGFTVYEDHAFFEASITICVFNLDTKEKLKLEDAYRLRVDVWDSWKRCRKDIFQIQIFNDFGLVVYEAGFAPLGYVHRGNIVIHYPRHHRHHWCHRHHWYHRCHCRKMKHW